VLVVSSVRPGPCVARLSIPCTPRIVCLRFYPAQEPVKYEVLAFLRGEGLRPRRTAMAILELFAQVGRLALRNRRLAAQPEQCRWNKAHAAKA